MNSIESLRTLRGLVHDRLTHAPLPMQFVAYLGVGGVCALMNVLLFAVFFRLTFTWMAAAAAFVASAAINYWLCVSFLFRRATGSSAWRELAAYAALVAVVANVDAYSTTSFVAAGLRPVLAKISATMIAFVFNFVGRRFLIFAERRPTAKEAAEL